MHEKILVLDFDGVILDSVNIKTEAFRELFQEQPKEIRQKIINYHIKNGGISRYRKFDYFYKNFIKKKISEKIKNELSNKFNKIIFKKILKCKYIKGAEKFIKKNLKYKLFISSGTPEEELRLICKKKGISKNFLGIYGSPRSKESHILKIKKKFKNTDFFIFIGDSKNDFDASMKTKIRFIQVGNNKIKKVKKENKIKNLLKLEKFLEKYDLY